MTGPIRGSTASRGVGGAMRIGTVAERLGVSTRTLRYYEELGLVTPSDRSAGGARRYREADFARVARIRELQAVLGFNLDEIREVLHADDRRAELRQEFFAGTTKKRSIEIVGEASRMNARLQEQVLAKIAVLQAYQAELENDAKAIAGRAKELGVKPATTSARS